MKKNFLNNKLILVIFLFLFFIISITSIKSASIILGDNSLVIKQVFWYIAGILIILSMKYFKNSFFIKHAAIFYAVGIISLLALLIFGDSINGAKCWFVLPGIGTIQPSEFMKIALILFLAKTISDLKDKQKSDLEIFIKVIVITLIPSVLTFLQPDTGVVIIYLIIMTFMLFLSGIKYRYFVIIGSILISFLSIVLILYFTSKDMFINILGSDFFLRVDRILDWQTSSGFQLENGLTAIGSGGVLGNGYLNTPIYFPEAATDFIFAVFSSNFGFVGSTFLILLLIGFDFYLIHIMNGPISDSEKFILAGIIGMIIYQQIQNISMTFGLLPITGITLPFISYGGSSLISYMIALGFIFNTKRH